MNGPFCYEAHSEQNLLNGMVIPSGLKRAASPPAILSFAQMSPGLAESTFFDRCFSLTSLSYS